MPRRLALSIALAATVALGACATKPPASDPEALAEYNEQRDPLEPTNRVFYRVNDFADRNAVRPVARFYQNQTPETVRTGLHNTLTNLGNPAQFANDVLQGHPHKAGNTLMRLVINSTVGVGGVFDVATGWGFPDHDNDFGLTLATWGVGEGPFLFLPLIGPSNPRDGVGYGANSALDPLTWASFGGSNTLGVARFGLSTIDGRARVLDATDSIEKSALDPYATIRSLYRQNRASKVDDARQDIARTIPAWFPSRPAPAPAPQPEPDRVAPRLAPKPGLVP